MSPEALRLVPKLKSRAEELNRQYYLDESSLKPIELFASLPDPFNDTDFDVYFVSAGKWNELKLPSAQGLASDKPGTNGRRFVLYRIPMTSLDTIYHELVHMYDPKIGKNLTDKNLPWAKKPEEIDAHMAGFIDIMKDRLNQSSTEERKKLKNELLSWMKKVKSEDDLEIESMPRLMKMTVWHLKQRPRNWRKFLSSIWNSLSKM